jgi:hypothetical protein
MNDGIGNDVEESGCGPNWGIVLAFACRDWRRPQKTTVAIAGVPTEIRTNHIGFE